MVKIEELPERIDKLVEEEVGPERQKAEIFRNRIDSTLAEIRNIANHLLEENVRKEIGNISEPVLTAADKLGSKILSLAETVRTPEQITYDTIVEYVQSVRRFQAQTVGFGAIWIRRLDKQFKSRIRELELRMRNLQSLTRILEDHVNGKYRQVKTFESLMKDARTLKYISEEAGDLEKRLRALDGERQDLGRLQNDLTEKMEATKRSEESQRVSSLENRIEGIRRSITILFDPLQKPVEKLLKLVEAKKQIVDAPTLNILSHYLGDPVKMVCEEQEGLSGLQIALSKLRVILEQNKLELKPARNRNAIKSIVEICNNNVLEPLRRDYLAAEQEMNQLLSSPILAELAAQRQDLEKRMKEVERAMGRLSLEFSNTKNRRDDMVRRMGQVKGQIEETFDRLTGETIDIDLK